MNWRNVRLIYAREIRDQLRDRRTLFMIAVLPLLLYPILGMSGFQLSQFLRTTEPRVLVIGNDQLAAGAGLPALFEERHFAKALFADPDSAKRFAVEFLGESPEGDTIAAGGLKATALDQARRNLQAGEAEVVLLFPADFGPRLKDLRTALQENGRSNVDHDDTAAAKSATTPPVDLPQPELLFNSAREKSRLAHEQVEQIINIWKSQIVQDNLRASRVPSNIDRPFVLQPHDIAPQPEQQARMWSRILPFVLFIWALTGAFYPAVDLCAGEKERGTLETLLVSPALRGEIVWGKLLTVMTFSAATALLNLISLSFTAQFVVSQLQLAIGAGASTSLDLPPLPAMLWLVVALFPMSALFSALCLASAAFARSTKEGQYYLMPLLLVTMPLMMLPMAPGAELSLGSSLIPITGVVLLLKELVQGNYVEALRYVLPVCLVTLACCWMAIRWAVYQFNQETVLFRESERFDLRRWIIHLVRDRRDTPSLAEAAFCVAIIFVIQFFTRLAVSANVPAAPNFKFVAMLVFVSQVVCIAVPALLMTLFLTGRPWKTLLLDRTPNIAACAVAVILAVVVTPIGLQLHYWISQLYPMQQAVMNDADALGNMLKDAPYPWLPYALMALLPAVCEELAFRGFILSGLRHLGSKWWAIGLSAVIFGMAHTVIQQSLAAAALGLIIGYIAVQTGSLLPCMLFHLTYNGVMLSTAQLPELVKNRPALAELFYRPAPDQILYSWPVVAACGLAALVPLVWLHRLRYEATSEEQLSDARARQSQQPLISSLSVNVD